MPPSAEVIRADFDRVETVTERERDQLGPARRLVAEVALRKQVLDIGCGTGVVARELAAKRGAKVTAIDIAPRMIDVARLTSSQSLRIDYRVADIMELSPRGFDVAIAVNALQHLPLAEIVDRMASAVVPGGKVLIADRFSTHGLASAPYNAISALATDDVPPDHDTSPFRVIRSTLRDVLPGVILRRHLGWRYTAIWTKP